MMSPRFADVRSVGTAGLPHGAVRLYLELLGQLGPHEPVLLMLTS